MNNAKRTEPTRSLLQGAPYVNAASTDIRARFAAIKKAQQETEHAKRPDGQKVSRIALGLHRKF